MNRFIEILAMALGGLSLFSVCFFGFAILTGRPLSGIPGIGEAFKSHELQIPASETTAPSTEEAAAGTLDREPRSKEDVVSAGIGVMGAWSLPSPYSQVELKSLADELKSKLAQLDARREDLERREAELDEKELAAREQYDLLESMRKHLEDYEAELDLRAQEIRRDEEAYTAKQRQVWADQATVLKALSDDLAGKRLLTYTPQEAAHILRSMEPEKATKILNAVPNDSWKEYVDAYTATEPPGKAP
ncbi:MAG TPA: hypothetical protein ENJ09_16210 [Planctomycetes bacterium]|nr:hypothetical protein [Planctomycetota bacterium]